MKRDLKQRIKTWGEEHGCKTFLETLKLIQESFSLVDFAAMLNVSPSAIRYWLCKYDLLRPNGRFEDFLKRNGFLGIDDYFSRPEIAKKSFRDLSKETGFTYQTISNAFNKFWSLYKGGENG